MMQLTNAAVRESTVMRAMFAARKEVFIDLLQWDLPVLAEAFELDQFDNPDAEYVILATPDGRHRASARLLRTEADHILGALYPQLCAEVLPSGPTVREITRFCLDRNQRASDRRIARNQLVTALAEHAVRNGITDYTGVAEKSWFDQIAAFGWECRALGPPLRLGGGHLVGLHIRIDDRTLDKLRATGIFAPLVMTIDGSQLPVGSLSHGLTS